MNCDKRHIHSIFGKEVEVNTHTHTHTHLIIIIYYYLSLSMLQNLGRNITIPRTLLALYVFKCVAQVSWVNYISRLLS